MIQSAARLFAGVTLGAVALSLLPGTAQAAADPSLPVQAGADDAAQPAEIVVTATKQGSQTLISTPLSIQAFSGKELESRQVNTITDLINLIPGASQTGTTGGGEQVYAFRGSGAGGTVGDGMIGYYLDDAAYGIPNFQFAPPLRYFDLDRVEVLLGPQGTLYGSGSMGGVMIFHTKDPDLHKLTIDAEAGISGTRGASDPNYTVSGAVSVPLIQDKVALRVSGGYDYQAGFANVYSGAPVGTPYKSDANDIKNRDIRATLLIAPDDRLTIKVGVWYFHMTQDYLSVMASLDPAYLAYQGTTPGYDRTRTTDWFGTIKYDFGHVEMTNASSYQISALGWLTNLVLPGLGNGGLSNAEAAHNFTNELRFTLKDTGNYHQIFGAYYQNASSPYVYNIAFPTLQIAGGTTTKTRNYSFFSEASYDLFDGKLVPLAGIRYFHDDRSAFDPTGAFVSSESPSVVTWRANLAYYPIKHVTVFVNVGTGFRSGILQSEAQAQAVVNDGIPSSTALKPDRLRNIEGGVKGSLADGSLRFGASVYNIRYSDLQSAYNTSIGLAAFANLGDTRTTGVDVELDWKTPLPGLHLAAVGNANSSKFTDVVPAFAAANPLAADGQRLFSTPAYNWRLDASYTTRLGASGWNLIAAGSGSKTGSTPVQATGISELGSYGLVNASLTLSKGAYEVSVFGQNIGDERGPTEANASTLLAGPHPRTFGARVRVHY